MTSPLTRSKNTKPEVTAILDLKILRMDAILDFLGKCGRHLGFKKTSPKRSKNTKTTTPGVWDAL